MFWSSLTSSFRFGNQEVNKYRSKCRHGTKEDEGAEVAGGDEGTSRQADCANISQGPQHFQTVFLAYRQSC